MTWNHEAEKDGLLPRQRFKESINREQKALWQAAGNGSDPVHNKHDPD